MPRREPIGVILTAGLLFLFWIVLSGILDWVHITMGLISSLIIAYIFPIITIEKRNGDIIRLGSFMLYLIPYLIRLQFEIIKANIDVIRIILDPALPISPTVRKFRTGLKSDGALATFGNSMTLTPGTLTIDINQSGESYIHYLTTPDAEQQKATEISNAVQRLFEGRGLWRRS